MASTALIDNVKQFETPLGVELAHVPAGLPVRAAAFLIDLVIKFMLLIVFAVVLVSIGSFGIGLFLIVFFLLDWFYFVIWDVANNGKPPGKIAMGIRTVHNDGTPISLAGSFVRSVLLIADFLPSFYICGIVSISVTRHFSRLGDLAAGTMVVYDKPKVEHVAKRVDHVHSLPVPLEQNERLNFLDFQDRFDRFSENRQVELCETLYPLTNKKKTESTRVVLGIAEGIRRSG
ncbi:MAG: RDD family protein [Gammaproteobacteria bacterium]|nr:RDD family protein [Gammaproteobacteria bacterium]